MRRPSRRPGEWIRPATRSSRSMRRHLPCALADARRGGLRSVAIAFMHSVRNPAHERRAAELARAAGFEEGRGLARGRTNRRSRPARRQCGRRRLPVARPDALPHGVPPRTLRRAWHAGPADDAEQRRPGRSRRIPRHQWRALGAGRRRRRPRGSRRRSGSHAHDRIRHGRHIDGHQSLRGPPAPPLLDRDRRCTTAGADDGH